jgi:2-dehydropantoate 2-reductase
MRIAMIGAGAMGGSFGGLLAGSGQDVTLIDTWQEHVDAINRDGLRITGALGEHRVILPAVTTPQESSWADMAIIFTDANSTEKAAQTATEVLKADGFAITCQNGIGNVEKLQQILGKQRVLGGSSMCSAAMGGPGHSILTHAADNTIGETDGSDSERLQQVKSLLEGAGFKVKTNSTIMTKIWSKFVLNCCINALCATSGLRQGELARLPELDALQSRIIDEVLAVTAAKGITLPDPDTRGAIKKQCWSKFSKPSMLQHVEAGKKTEIDALNGALVREAQSLGIATPYNEALVALLKGRELHQQRAIHEPDLDYAAWEAEVNS